MDNMREQARTLLEACEGEVTLLPAGLEELAALVRGQIEEVRARLTSGRKTDLEAAIPGTFALGMFLGFIRAQAHLDARQETVTRAQEVQREVQHIWVKADTEHRRLVDSMREWGERRRGDRGISDEELHAAVADFLKNHPRIRSWRQIFTRVARDAEKQHGAVVGYKTVERVYKELEGITSLPALKKPGH